jgi:hypothetical protein
MPNIPVTFAAVELVSPLFLLGCLAMLIPLVLHLLARQRAPERPFSTLQFLKMSVAKTARRRRLRDMLLLALRMAFVGLLAAALARPLLTGLARYGRHGTAMAVVLDNSLSMSLADGGEVRFERGKSLALELVDRLQEGDEVGLVLTGGPSRQQPSLYRELANAAHLIETSEVCLAGADIPASIRAAQELLEQSRAPNKQIFLITDLQASGFRGRQAHDEEGLTDLALVVLDVHQGRPQNLAVESIELRGTLPGVGMPVSVRATIRNCGAAPQAAQVEIVIDAQLVHRLETNRLAPGESQVVDFPYLPVQAGIHTGRLQITGHDACQLDNSAFFVVDTQSPLQVGLVDHRRADEPPYRGASYYLERALRPPALGAYAIEVTPLRADLLAAEPLSSFAALWCVDLRAPDEAAVAALRQYATAGGTLVWVCGPNTDAAALTEAMTDSGLLPGPLHQPSAEEASGSHWGFLDASHPVLAELDAPPSLYLGVTVNRYIALNIEKDSSTRVLARLDNGAPVLTVQALGHGQVWWLLSGAHASWTTLPLRPIFMPLVNRLVLQSARWGQGPLAVAPGTAAVLRLADEPEPVTAEVTLPERPELMRIASTEVDGRQEVRFDETHAAGIYRVRVVAGKRPVEHAFAVNPDPSEADPATIDAGRLNAMTRNGALLAHDAAELRQVLARVNEGTPLIDLLLGVVFLCGLAELVVANRLGGQAPLALPPTARERVRAVLDRVADLHQLGDSPPARHGAARAVIPSRK